MAQNDEIKDQRSPGATNSAGDQSIEEVPLFKRKGIIIPLLIIILAAAGAIYWYIGQLGYVSTDDAFVDSNRLSVSSKILGRITELAVDEGDTVKQGQLLVKLDPTDMIAQQKQAEAALELAKESISLAQVNLAKTQDDLNRASRQFKDNIIPKEQYDHTQKAYEAAKAELNIDKTKIGTAEAQLNVIKANLKNTAIYSTMDGIVAKRWVLTGDVVSPGQPIFTIFNLDSVWVTADLEETKLGSIRPGDKVDISVDAYPDQKFAGKVYQIGSNTASEFSLIPPDNASGNFTKVTQRVPIKMTIEPVNNFGQSDPSPSIKLLPGMSVEIQINIKKK